MKNNPVNQESKGTEIILRALEPSDIDLLYHWENDPSIWKVSNTIVPYSKFILNKYLENSHLDIYQTKQLRLMIDLREKEKDAPKTIGTVDLFDFDPYHNRAGVGILIGDKSERKKGFASLSLKKLINYAFDTLQLHQIYCNILTENKESLSLFQKHGFELIGEKKEWIKMPGKYIGEYMLQLINPQD
jgi:diamine N-acetyltransferase